MRTRSGSWALFALLALALQGACSPTKPTQDGITTPQPPTQRVRRLETAGNVALTTIGETSQLSVTAVYMDGSTADVTRHMQWSGADPRVVTLNSTGLVTATGFGAALLMGVLNANNSPNVTAATVTVTPPGTFAIRAIVSEPTDNDFLEFGGGLSGVRAQDVVTGRDGLSDYLGRVTLADLPASRTRLRLEKEGYEPALVEVGEIWSWVAIQPVIRIVAGDTTNPSAFGPTDVTYDIGGIRCGPCRLVRVAVPTAGTLRVRVAWQASVNLSLFVDGRMLANGTSELIAEVPISSPREVLVYFGTTSERQVQSWTPVTFQSSMRD